MPLAFARRCVGPDSARVKMNGRLADRPQTQPKRVLFVNRFYRPDQSATAQLLSDLGEYLAASGLRVVVLTGRQAYVGAASPLPARENLAGVEVHRLFSFAAKRRRLGSRLLSDVTFMAGVAVWLLRFGRYGDIVVAKTDPPMLGLVTALAARVRGMHALNWLQDLFPEVAFALRVPIPGPVRAALVRLRDWYLRRAVANVTIGELMADRVARIGGADKVRVVHNWAPFGWIRPVPHAANALRAEWGFDGKFVVGYSGNLGRVHEFETILDAARRLQDLDDIAFVFVGDGAQRASVLEAADAMRLRNVSFQPYQPAQRLAESLSAADAHIVSLRPDLEGLVVPSKFYGILAAGRPAIFIGAPGGEIARLVHDHACGVTIAQGDSAALASAIVSLRDGAEQRAAMAQAAIDVSTRTLGRERSLTQWHSILSALASDPRTSGTLTSVRRPA
jgi:colanic acid biosynthesis glycosyl transferase WcaI